MKIEELYRNIDKNLPDNMSWITLKIEGMPRFVHMEVNRHRVGISPTAQSTRFTLQKEVLVKPLKDLIYLTGDKNIDDWNLATMEHIKNLAEKGYKSDKMKPNIPEALLMTVVYTFNIEALKHFIALRSAKGALKQIQELAKMLEDTYESSTANSVESYTPAMIASKALRTCYLTGSTGDFHKEVSYIKRIGVTMKHSSVLEHLVFKSVLPSSIFKKMMMTSVGKFVNHNYTGGEPLVTFNINMRIMLALRDEYPEIYHLINTPFIPKSYKEILRIDIPKNNLGGIRSNMILLDEMGFIPGEDK